MTTEDVHCWGHHMVDRQATNKDGIGIISPFWVLDTLTTVLLQLLLLILALLLHALL